MSALFTLGASALLLGVLLVTAHLFERYDPKHPEYTPPEERDGISLFDSEDETAETTADESDESDDDGSGFLSMPAGERGAGRMVDDDAEEETEERDEIEDVEVDESEVEDEADESPDDDESDSRAGRIVDD